MHADAYNCKFSFFNSGSARNSVAMAEYDDL